MSESSIEERVADLEGRIARLERERRPPAHHRDMTPKQRRIVNAVSDAASVPVADLFAASRGPARTADARAVLYRELSTRLEMSAAQIGRFVGRTPRAVTQGLVRVRQLSVDSILDAVRAELDPPPEDEPRLGFRPALTEQPLPSPFTICDDPMPDPVEALDDDIDAPIEWNGETIR